MEHGGADDTDNDTIYFKRGKTLWGDGQHSLVPGSLRGGLKFRSLGTRLGPAVFTRPSIEILDTNTGHIREKLTCKP